MPRPGEYLVDVTEGITRVEDLPKPPALQAVAQPSPPALPPLRPPLLRYRDGQRPDMTWATRWPGGPATSASPTPSTTAPGAAAISPPTCPTWPAPGPATPIGSWPWPSGWSSRTAYPIRPPVGTSGATTASSSPSPPSRTGWRPGEKKRRHASGPITSIGPSTASPGTSPLTSCTTAPSASCRSSITAPSSGCATRSSTTTRLTGYPEVLPPLPGGPDRPRVDPSRDHHRRLGAVSAADFPGLRPCQHQVCRFHILAELNKAVLRAVAQARKRLAAQKPKLPRGRPSRRRRNGRSGGDGTSIGKSGTCSSIVISSSSCTSRRRTADVAAHHPGLPRLRALRRIVEEIYRLFDRRCRTETALAKLARLRIRSAARRAGADLQKLQSSDLEKALTFLDDRLLGSTSNAVERGNRRHRKMQKTVYRVRTQANSAVGSRWTCFARPKAEGRNQTTRILHRARGG